MRSREWRKHKYYVAIKQNEITMHIDIISNEKSKEELSFVLKNRKATSAQIINEAQDMSRE